MLGEVEETIYAVDDDEEDSEEVKVRQMKIVYWATSLTTVQTISRKSEMLFVRGRRFPLAVVVVWRPG